MKILKDKMINELNTLKQLSDKTDDMILKKQCEDVAMTLQEVLNHMEYHTYIEKHCNFYCEAVDMLDGFDFDKYDYEFTVVRSEK